VSDPIIPFGYKRITGQLQKGDGVWNGTRFAKVKKQYPSTDFRYSLFAIRKCVVEQTEIPGTETPVCLDE
jgi:hypothetical protein